MEVAGSTKETKCRRLAQKNGSKNIEGSEGEGIDAENHDRNVYPEGGNGGDREKQQRREGRKIEEENLLHP